MRHATETRAPQSTVDVTTALNKPPNPQLREVRMAFNSLTTRTDVFGARAVALYYSSARKTDLCRALKRLKNICSQKKYTPRV